MPRHARVLLPGVPLHIIQRGHYRQRCFFTRADGLKYLDLLRIHLGYAGGSLHAYVLMPNHVHLLASFDEIELAPHLMRCVGQGYTQYLNARLGRRGTLWDGRYRSSPVDSERYVLVCHRYIEMNPVRAKLVESPEAYVWSSFMGNAGLKENRLLVPHLLYVGLGRSHAERCASYRALFEDVLTDEQVGKIRQAVNRNKPVR